MKKVSFYFAVAASCLLAACAKNEVPAGDAPVRNVYYIQASGDVNTKAGIDNTSAAFSWSEGDQIAVFSGGTYHKSNALASGGSSTASFSFASDIDDGRANFALYPASLVFDDADVRSSSAAAYTASGLAVTLPGEYLLSEIKDDNSPVPMIAANAAGEGLAFKQLGALLRLQVKNLPKQTEYITFNFNGKKVQGVFTLTGVAPGTSALETAAASSGSDVITVYNDVFSTFQDAIVVNIPVPAGTYTDVTVTSWDADDHKINAITTPIKSGASWTASRKSARKQVATLPVFTVANGKKVVFAPGNLQAVLGATFVNNVPNYATSWNFANQQYDAIGDAKTTKSGSYTVNSFRTSNTIGDSCDLFAWFGQSATGFTGDYEDDKFKYGIIRPSSSITAFIGTETGVEDILLDWGHNTINDAVGTYPADTWRTPSPDDWNVAVLTRDNHIFLRATITDASPVAHGLIITPDQYSHPTSVAPFSNTNALDGACSDNQYTINDWKKLEAAGCVFLPMTNHRQKSGSYVETIWPGDGVYWTSKSIKGSKPKGCAFLFTDTNLGDIMEGETTNVIKYNKSLTARYIGCAVRLVRDVN